MPFQKIPEDFQVWTSKELNEYLKTLEDQLQFAKMFPGDDPDFLSSLEMGASACRSEITRRNGARTQNGASPPEPHYEIVSGVEKEDIDFLWKDRIPRGKITDFSGDPGVGKSTVASMIAATLSVGKALPFDKEPEAPMRSLIISNEDTPGDVLRPRLERMKADISMIAIPSRKLAVHQLDAQMIETIVKEFAPAFVVIDPVISYTQGRSSNKPDEVREYLNGISAIADRYKVAVVIIRHFNKNIAHSAMYRSSGTIDWMAVARAAFVFAEDPVASQRRFMGHVKASLSKRQPTVEYYIEDDGTFRWGIETDQSADDIVKAGGKDQTQTKANLFLEKFLANGPMPFNEILDAAEKKGITRGSLFSAQKQMGLKSKKEKETGTFIWSLPLFPS